MIDIRRALGFFVAAGIMVFSYPALAAPEGWTCPPDWFGDGFCDCGCGALDSDCTDATVESCEFCGWYGSCQASQACSGIVPDENWLCHETPGVGPQGHTIAFGPPHNAFCRFFDGTETEDAAFRVTPSGQFNLTCQYSGLPPIAHTLIARGFPCTFIWGGLVIPTFDTLSVRTTSGEAVVRCTAEIDPTSH